MKIKALHLITRYATIYRMEMEMKSLH